MNSHEHALMQTSGRSGAIAPPGFAQPYSIQPGYMDEPEEAMFNPVQLFWYVVHYRWLIGAFALCGLAAGLFLTWSQTPMYRAATTVEILTSGIKALEDFESVAALNDLRTLETQRTKILSRDLARRVAFELGLADNDAFIAPAASISIYNLFNRAFGTANRRDVSDLTPEQRLGIAVGTVTGGLNASFIRNTAVMTVTFEHPDPQLAALVVNQVAASFIDQAVDQRSSTSNLARQFIQEQVIETKTKLEASERELLAYAEAEGILLDADENSLIQSNIVSVNKAIADATQELFGADRYVEQIEAGGADTLPEVFESASIQGAKERLAELRATYQEKLATLKPAFPEMRRLNAQISETAAQMNAEIASIASGVRLRAEQLAQKRAVLQAELASLEQKQAEFQRKNVRYTILKREVDSNRTQYESLIAKLNDVGVGADLRNASAMVVDAAVQPGAPFSPRLSRSLLMGLMAALGLAALAVYILELLNNTFSIPDQVETDLKLPVLGIIPAVAPSEMEDAFDDPNSALSEAYRTLRTSVQFTSTDGIAKLYVVTSAEPSEGKTATAFKLAQEFAALSKRVLVIDADLRKAKMHRLFKTDNLIGLSNLMTSIPRSNVETPVFRKTADPNIEFVAAGTLPPNPANLLASDRMGVVLRFCASRYDVVVVDAPPVMGLADAIILSRYADATLLVVSAKQVKRRAAKDAVKRLTAASANLIGVAMTKFDVSRLDYNYAYRYMRYNYYSYADDTPRLTDRNNAHGRSLDLSNGFARRFWNRIVAAVGRSGANTFRR